MAGPIIVTVERRIEAPPERVFDAWLDPARAGRWLFATPDGTMERVEIDARVGGRFQIDERRGGELAEHFGEYLEIDRPNRLVFSFAALRGAGFTRVTVTIAPDGDCSRLTLVHEMDPRWAEYEDRTREGWTRILEGLAGTVAGDGR
ncbi:MAG TPA: SRPBCC domain-containing protein [Allosphingosinicella sp.]|nr:SRPBCC domain-containing protein [Allosphingosinicella sp.]